MSKLGGAPVSKLGSAQSWTFNTKRACGLAADVDVRVFLFYSIKLPQPFQHHPLLESTCYLQLVVCPRAHLHMSWLVDVFVNVPIMGSRYASGNLATHKHFKMDVSVTFPVCVHAYTHECGCVRIYTHIFICLYLYMCGRRRLRRAICTRTEFPHPKDSDQAPNLAAGGMAPPNEIIGQNTILSDSVHSWRLLSHGVCKTK